MLELAGFMGNSAKPRVEVPANSSVLRRETREFPQARARETHAALLQSAAVVFSERGFDDAQTPDIAAGAGVSVGTFYRYFADKRQAFIELIEAYLHDSFTSVMSNLTPDAFGTNRTAEDRRATVNHVIDVLFTNTEMNPRLHRVFLALSLRDPEVEQIRIDFEEQSRILLASLLEQVTSRERIPDPAAAAEVIQIAAQEVALATIGSHGPVRPKGHAKALRRALADMLYRYVFGDN
jgi:AcrR family transcriptional regulator